MSAAPPLVLDTSIVIHLIRGSALGRQLLEVHQLRARADIPMISVVTVGEVLAFARKLGWGGPR